MNDKINIDIEIPMIDDSNESSYMERTHHIDLSFGIHPIALYIAQQVNNDIERVIPKIKRDYKESEYDSHHVSMNTFPFYNCREKGVGINVYPEMTLGGKSLVMCWAENKNSDDIVVYKDLVDFSINPPTLNDFKEDFWTSKKFFNCNSPEKAISYIIDNIEDYHNKIAINDVVKENQTNNNSSLKL